MGEGRVFLSNKVTPGLVRWASPTFTRLHQGAGSVRMWAYVMNVHWTASDSKVGDYVIMVFLW